MPEQYCIRLETDIPISECSNPGCVYGMENKCPNYGKKEENTEENVLDLMEALGLKR